MHGFLLVASLLMANWDSNMKYIRAIVYVITSTCASMENDTLRNVGDMEKKRRGKNNRQYIQCCTSKYDVYDTELPNQPS